MIAEKFEIEELIGKYDDSIFTDNYLLLKYEKLNINYFKYTNENMHVTLDDVIEIKNNVSKLWDNKPSLSLCDFREIRGSYTSEAQEYSAQSDDIKALKHKEALVFNSIGISFLVGLYLRFFKPKVETKSFNNLKEAIEWLVC